jgi:hypothetical protein
MYGIPRLDNSGTHNLEILKSSSVDAMPDNNVNYKIRYTGVGDIRKEHYSDDSDAESNRDEISGKWAISAGWCSQACARESTMREKPYVI